MALNNNGSRYVIIGGFAMMRAGYPRFTSDVDILVDTGLENERNILDAVSTLPDQAAKELYPGEIEQFVVVRVADEFVVDILSSASGLKYKDLQDRIQFETVDGVSIPFAGHEDLWRMKSKTHRDKDIADLAFLRQWFEEHGMQPPDS
jgi:hypothetical protein